MFGRVRLSAALAAVLALVAAPGCGTLDAYPGPKRAPSELASIRPAVLPDRHIMIDAVDERELGSLQDRARLLPGVREIVASVVIQPRPQRLDGRPLKATRAVIGQHRLRFEAKAGHSYVVCADYYLYGPRIWIEDETDAGRIVAQAVTRLIDPSRDVGAR